MEHLPHGKHELNIMVPYICTEPYDHNGDWMDYPDKKGISLENIRFRMFYKYPPERIPPFLQNWLFFGLLRAVLQCDNRKANEDFKYVDATGQVSITTRALPTYLQKWREDLAALSPEDRRDTFSRNFAIFKEASGLVYFLSEYPSTASLELLPFPIISREISLSFALLGDALETAMRSFMTEAEYQKSEIAQISPSFWSTGSFLLEKMEEEGWCPFIINGIQGSLNIDAIYAASTLGPPNDVYDHRRCSDDRCVARSNLAKHSREGCFCSEMISPDMSEVASIIREGQTPVLRFYPRIDEAAGMGRLEVSPGQLLVPYVAISHVWSDGLGNPKGNSMPQCQISRVQEAVNVLYGSGIGARENAQPIPFWIDTLCVPNGKGLEKIRDEAIRAMKQIYLDANKVLVIDAEVAACSMSTDPLEILLRICLSNWLRRLWTVQEGVFAKSLHFLITTETISFSELLYEKVQDNIGTRTGKYLGWKFSNIFSRSLEQLNPAAALRYRDDGLDEIKEVYMIREIASRTSTYKSDEAVCLALLLGLDPKPILDAKGDDKMCILIRFLNGIIPPGMMLQSGERIHTRGYRWAPRSLLISPGSKGVLIEFASKVPDEYPSTECMPRPPGILDEQNRGLKVMFPGLLLDKIRAKGGLGWSFTVDTTNGLGGKEIGKHGKPPLFWRVVHKDEGEDQSWDTMSPKKQDSQKMAIIICGYGPYWRNSIDGLLVRIVDKDKDGMHVVSRVCTVVVSGTPEYDGFEWLKDPESSCTGKWQSVRQMWCVD
jgi:hypothetical protein